MSAAMNRRRFGQMLAVAGLAAADAGNAQQRAQEEQAETMDAEAILLRPNGWCPNNAELPVLLYRAAIPPQGSDPAAVFEQHFTANGWPPQWRNGVYTFHHYHSTAHEVLGFAAGSAKLALGGPNAREMTVRAGDVLLLPTGTGHCELSKSDDFLVVGAYPPDQHWDICRAAPDAKATERMRTLPFPHSDPVHGNNGPLAQHWLTARKT